MNRRIEKPCVVAKSDQKKDNELHLNAWSRFERAVDVVAKSPPLHRTKKKKSHSKRKAKREKELMANDQSD